MPSAPARNSTASAAATLGNHRVPGARRLLTEQPRGRIPGTVAALQQPTPVARLRQHDPDRLAQRACQMSHRGVHVITRSRLAITAAVSPKSVSSPDDVGQSGEQPQRRFVGSRQRLLQRNETGAAGRGNRAEACQRHRTAAVVGMRRPAGPCQPDPPHALRQPAIQPLAPCRDAGRVGEQVRHLGRDRLQRGVHQARHAGQPAMRGMTGHIGPAVAVLLHAGDGRQQRSHFRAAAQDQLLAAIGDQRDVAGELDGVAVALVAHHQQAALAGCACRSRPPMSSSAACLCRPRSGCATHTPASPRRNRRSPAGSGQARDGRPHGPASGRARAAGRPWRDRGRPHR